MTGTGAHARARVVRGAAAALALLLLVLLLLPAGATPALGQADPLRLGRGERSSLSLELLAMEAVIDPSGSLRLHVTVHNSGLLDRADVRVVATVHRRTIGRFALQQAMNGGELGSIVHPVVTDLEPIPRRGSRTVEIIQTAEEMGLDRPGLQNVYPLVLQLLTAGEVVDEIVTSLVVVPEQVSVPLAVSLLIPLSLPPSRDAEGVVVDADLLEALGDGGVLHETALVLDANPNLGTTIGLDGHTLADLADVSDGFTLREDGAISIRPADSALADRARLVLASLGALGSRSRQEALALPYADADLVALVRNGLGGELERHLEDGATLVATVTGEEASPRILVPSDGLDAATLEQIRATGVEAIVLPEELLSVGNGNDRSPSPVRRLRSQGTPLVALVPDPWLGEPLAAGSPDGPVVAAQRLMAEIASVYFELPGTPQRGLLIAPPPGEQVPPEVLAALAGPLARAPFIRTAPLSQLEQRVAPNQESVALAYSSDRAGRELPITYLAMLTSARRALGSLSGVLEDEQTLPARLDSLLLQSASVHYRGDALPRGRELLRSVSGTVADIYGGVDVVESPPVTLTDVEGQLPVSIRSSAEVPLRVRVSVESARYAIDGGPTRELVLAPGRTETLTFRVRALSPGGTSPVQVVVRDMAGDLDLAQGTVVVRSTAFSVAGALTTAGAGAILLLFGLSQLARRRRATGRGRPRSAATSDARSEATVPDAATSRAPGVEITATPMPTTSSDADG